MQKFTIIWVRFTIDDFGGSLGLTHLPFYTTRYRLKWRRNSDGEVVLVIRGTLYDV